MKIADSVDSENSPNPKPNPNSKPNPLILVWDIDGLDNHGTQGATLWLSKHCVNFVIISNAKQAPKRYQYKVKLCLYNSL